MAWVVDTSVVLDLIVNGSTWRTASLACLQRHLADGLCICPVTFVEVGPAFGGDARAADAFFQVVPIATSEPWTSADTELAHRLWNDHQARRRAADAKAANRRCAHRGLRRPISRHHHTKCRSLSQHRPSTHDCGAVRGAVS